MTKNEHVFKPGEWAFSPKSGYRKLFKHYSDIYLIEHGGYTYTIQGYFGYFMPADPYPTLLTVEQARAIGYEPPAEYWDEVQEKEVYSGNVCWSLPRSSSAVYPSGEIKDSKGSNLRWRDLIGKRTKVTIEVLGDDAEKEPEAASENSDSVEKILEEVACRFAGLSLDDFWKDISKRVQKLREAKK